MITTSSTNNRDCLITAILLFIFTDPYFFWHGFLGSTLVNFLFAILLGVLCYKNKYFDKTSKTLFIIFFLLFLLNTINLGMNINHLLIRIPLIFIPFTNISFAQKVYNYFLIIYCSILSISLCVWIFVFLGKVPELTSIEPLNPLKPFQYVHYPFLIMSPLDIFRFHACYDEPGVVGTLSAMLLCIQKFNIKDIKTWILLISGMCSLSLFFFILVAIYFFVYFLLNNKKIHLIILGFFLILAWNLIQNDSILYDEIGSRLELSSDGKGISGNNRVSDDAVSYLTAIRGSSEYWLGTNNIDKIRRMTEGGSSIYITLLINGVLFFVLYVSFMIVYGIHHKKKLSTFILFMFVFFSCVYQRPNLFDAYFIFIWTCLARVDYFIIKE